MRFDVLDQQIIRWDTGDGRSLTIVVVGDDSMEVWLSPDLTLSRPRIGPHRVAFGTAR